MGRFGNVIGNFWQIVNLRKRLMAFTASYGQITPSSPTSSPRRSTSSARSSSARSRRPRARSARVEGALNFFVDYYVTLADYKSVIDRLTTFNDAIDRARLLARSRRTSPSSKLRVRACPSPTSR